MKRYNIEIDGDTVRITENPLGDYCLVSEVEREYLTPDQLLEIMQMAKQKIRHFQEKNLARIPRNTNGNG